MPSASGPAAWIRSSVPTNDTVTNNGFDPRAWACFTRGATVLDGPTTITASGLAALTLLIAASVRLVCRAYDAVQFEIGFGACQGFPAQKPRRTFQGGAGTNGDFFLSDARSGLAYGAEGGPEKRMR